MIRKSLRHYLAAFKPSFWIRTKRTSRAWDRRLNALLDAGIPFTDIGCYTARIGDYKVWIENHPYASFTLYGDGKSDIGVSRSTVARAREWLEICAVNGALGRKA